MIRQCRRLHNCLFTRHICCQPRAAKVRALPAFDLRNSSKKRVVLSNIIVRKLASSNQSQAMSENLRFDGRVVVVTGAGGGLGKEYALAFAERGASVVVNDLGSSRSGEGHASNFADRVVEEICKNGGKAVANYDSVEEGDKVIQTALDSFGRIDVLINNAGILRDKSFGRMTIQEWDLIHRVHLRGSFLVTKAAWQTMRQQKFGRIIMTSSSSGIYGNFGQSNYSAAKLGLVGLSNTLALEGKKHNIRCNAIAPVAGTRLTEDLMPPELFSQLKAEYVVPLVLWLCHESCEETGGLFETGGGYTTKLRWQRSDGAVLRVKGQPMRPEHVRDNWTKLTDFENSHVVESQGESTIKAAEAIRRIENGDNDIYSSHPIRPALAKKHVFPKTTFSYSNMEVIMYALGVGASTKQLDHLKFLFEMSGDFCVIPTFGVLPSFSGLSNMLSAPGLDINPAKILHGEQYTEIFKPIPTEGKLVSQTRIVEVLDKGSGAAIISNVETFDESGEKLFFNQSITFAVGYGNFGGKRSSAEVKETAKPPNRAPDASVEQQTANDQAALYRLSGDKNPLHIEPAFAAMGGFKKPILHGLCSYGFACRHVMSKYGGNDPANIKAMKARFSKPVIPGQTLRTDMWKEGSRVHFQTVVVETGATCLSGGYVDLRGGPDGETPKSQAPSPKPTSDELQSDALFEGVKGYINADIVRKVGAIYQWDITKNGKIARQWTLDLKNGSGSMTQGKAPNPECTLTISDSDVMDMFSGKLDPQKAFFSGKFKISGNIMLSQKLDVLFKSQAKL